MLVFLGDSITARWRPIMYKRFFSKHKPLNLARDGVTTDYILNALKGDNCEILQAIKKQDNPLSIIVFVL